MTHGQSVTGQSGQWRQHDQRIHSRDHFSHIHIHIILNVRVIGMCHCLSLWFQLFTTSAHSFYEDGS